jgi:hypothetical protein
MNKILLDKQIKSLIDKGQDGQNEKNEYMEWLRNDLQQRKKLETNLEELMNKDRTSLDDRERKAFFFIIAGNDDLYSKVNFIYDFKERSIKSDCFENESVDFCSSSNRLIKLAFNLYNSYPADVYDTFYLLDDKNFKLAINAIRIRFEG